MPFRAVAIALLLPPIFFLWLALIGLLIQRRHARSGRILTWAALLALLALAVPLVSDTLLVTLEQALPLAPPPDSPPQAIVILGGDVARTEEGGKLLFHIGPLSLERVRAGAALYRHTGLPILVSGGAVHAGDAPVAALMARSLMQDFQAPVRWAETFSRDTWENAHLSAAILREQGIGSVYLVTQAWHMRRAVLAFAAAGIRVTAAPTHLDRPAPPILEDFLPSVGGWRTSYLALHEWIGCLWYASR